MDLLLKLAGLWIALGFAFGLVAKTQLKGPYRIIPLIISLAPLMAHFAYSYQRTTEISQDETQLALYVGSSLVLLGMVFWVGWQSLQRKGASLMLLPLVMAAIYSFGPLTWLMNATDVVNIGLNSVPTRLFYAATLFVSSLLFAFTLNLPKLPERKKAPKDPSQTQAKKGSTAASSKRATQKKRP